MADIDGNNNSEIIYGTPDADGIRPAGGDDTVYCRAGNDIVGGTMWGDDKLYGEAGDDQLLGDPGAADGNDEMYGGDGRDTIQGGSGNDWLEGGADNDLLYGDWVVPYNTDGRDTLDGGLGNDILHGGGGGDLLRDDPINSGGGVDDLWGEAGNDVLECYAGNDFLNGGIGDDRLSGGAGDDHIDGGDGVDTAVYAAPYAVVGVTVDLSIAGPQDTKHGFDTLSNVENLRGTGANDILKGNDGSNKLEGSGGYDTLAGGAGNDLLDGGPGNDTASYEAATGRVVVSVGISNPQDTGAAGFDTLVGVENLIGSAYNDELSGNAGANLLDGKLGTDFLYAGAGNDTYVLKDVHKISDFPQRFAFDRVVELAGEGTDTVRVERPGATNIVTSYWLEANVENGIVTGMDIFTLNGNELNNQLTGNSAANTLNGNGGNDTLSGSGGSDTLNGGAGNDTYVVDNAGDRVVEAAGAGTDLVLSGISWTLGANVENLILTGTNSVSGAGNTLANTLIGNSATNGLSAGDGDDRLSGAAGNDILVGGAGNDTLIGGVDLDIFLFNTALDAASNVDTISDFSVANDTVRLENAIFTALTSAGTLNADAFHIGAAAGDAEDRIIYNSATGGLFYDSDGTGAGGMTQFAKLAPGLALTNADFFVV